MTLYLVSMTKRTGSATWLITRSAATVKYTELTSGAVSLFKTANEVSLGSQDPEIVRKWYFVIKLNQKCRQHDISRLKLLKLHHKGDVHKLCLQGEVGS